MESGGNAGITGGGGVSLAGLTGPMLLGSRAALAMPYDMLGITDSVDMIEVMSRQQQPVPGREQDSSDDESEPTSDDDHQGQKNEGFRAASGVGAASVADVAPEDLAAVFAADGDALELADLISGLDGGDPVA